MCVHTVSTRFCLSLWPKPVMWALVLVWSVLQAACSKTPSPVPLEVIQHQYVITLSISATDSIAALEQKFGGKVRSFHPEAGFAVLGVNEVPPSDPNIKLEKNSSLGAPEGGVVSNALQPLAWAGWSGGANAWGSGWGAWGSGWGAWSSGQSVPSLPQENNPTWMHIRLPQAHAISRNFGAGVTVAVIDTGIDLAHPGFQGRLAPQSDWKDFVDGDGQPQEVPGDAYGHGTVIAGIIAQVAPKATILPIRVLGPEGSCTLEALIQAIDHAIGRGAKVINLSLGSPLGADALSKMMAYAKQKKVYSFASLGNEATYEAITYPARLGTAAEIAHYLYGVGSVSANDALSSFSNWGASGLLWAPGEKIFSFFPEDKLVHATGTSFATPLMAGAFALAYSEISNPYQKDLLGTLFTRSFEKNRLLIEHYPPSANWCQSTIQTNDGRPWCHGVGRLDVERLIRDLPDWTPPTTKPTLDRIFNGNFEAASLAGWIGQGNLELSTTSTTDIANVFSGKNAVALKGSGSLSQTVSLEANQTYTLSVWTRLDSPGESMELRVSGHGQASQTHPIGGTSWARHSITFTTGSTNTAATIALEKTSGNSFGHADLFSLTPGTTLY